ncbi:relaxase/mobilization nuclease domain-containing protein [Desulfosarcina sp. OttesenSCG-928-G17]|nr:relaxase/mobilization nuclease domain-containing protein [Desulfosarcina sp. OttesenSCG-928-G17]
MKKRKNGVALYHEYISLKYQEGYTKEELREILKDLTEQYTQARANNCLVYAVIHEQHNQIHSHLMISGNELESSRAHYFSQAEFEEIKNKTREYAYEKYPKLEHQEVKKEKIKENGKRKSKSIDSEVQLKKRTGKQSEREKVREKLRTIFKLSKSQDDFITNMRLEKLEVYQRGKTFGFLNISTGRKYRLKTIELESEFWEMSERFENEKPQSKEQVEKERKETDPEKQEIFKGKFDTKTFGKSKSGKDYIRESVKFTLENSKTFEEFIKRLDEQHIKIYRINDTFGFIDIQTNWKYRLATLGLEEEFENFVIKIKQPKGFKEKIKDLGKRLFHEAVNDLEHLITGEKPEMEDEIWTQEEAGKREKDKKKNYRKMYENKESSNKDELSKEEFKGKLRKMREENKKENEKEKNKTKPFVKER